METKVLVMTFSVSVLQIFRQHRNGKKCPSHNGTNTFFAAEHRLYIQICFCFLEQFRNLEVLRAYIDAGFTFNAIIDIGREA